MSEVASELELAWDRTGHTAQGVCYHPQAGIGALEADLHGPDSFPWNPIRFHIYAFSKDIVFLIFVEKQSEMPTHLQVFTRGRNPPHRVTRFKSQRSQVSDNPLISREQSQLRVRDRRSFKNPRDISESSQTSPVPLNEMKPLMQ